MKAALAAVLLVTAVVVSAQEGRGQSVDPSSEGRTIVAEILSPTAVVSASGGDAMWTARRRAAAGDAVSDSSARWGGTDRLTRRCISTRLILFESPKHLRASA